MPIPGRCLDVFLVVATRLPLPSEQIGNTRVPGARCTMAARAASCRTAPETRGQPSPYASAVPLQAVFRHMVLFPAVQLIATNVRQDRLSNGVCTSSSAEVTV